MWTSELRQPVPDALLDQQRQALLRGARPPIGELLADTPFYDDREAQLDLLYNEMVVLEELGVLPGVDEYIARYPHLQSDIEVHFEIHQVVHGRGAPDTASLQDATDRSSETGVHRAATLPVQDYDVGELLGHGAMADVFRARHRGLNRDVALKVFRDGLLLTARHGARIRTEAEATARLAHPNIVQIFEVGECDGVPYLALELAEQGTLAQRLQRFPYTPGAAAELIATLAEAVQHAHERQVVHRDLKPANVLFAADGVAKISDFGLAKVLLDDQDTAADVTRTGETLGTPRYMAPEQAAGDRSLIGPATDVHALGALLYECLTGCAPFMATSVPDTLQMILHDDPRPPRRWQSGVPRDLETICLKCLQKAPAARYPTAQDLADDLRRFLRREPIRARRTPLWERTWKWCRRKPAHAALIGWGTLACVGSLTAAIVIPQAEYRRVEGLRQQVASLMAEGRKALDRDDFEQAEARFQSAWQTVEGEPALADHATSVTGWLNQARNASSRYTWRQRVPPPAYDDRRDEALLLSLLLPHVAQPQSAAEAAIDAAFDLTLPNDPRWRGERSRLHLLRVQLRASAEGPAAALALLEGTEVEPTRQVELLRSSLLGQLGRESEARVAAEAAAGLPGDAVAELFASGMDLARERKFNEAAAVLGKVLRTEPEHFAARLLQAVCFVNLGRNSEAQVALTACVAQRPFSSWSYYYRAQAELALGDASSASDDLQRVLETRPSEAARAAASSQLAVLDARPGPESSGARQPATVLTAPAAGAVAADSGSVRDVAAGGRHSLEN